MVGLCGKRWQTLPIQLEIAKLNVDKWHLPKQGQVGFLGKVLIRHITWRDQAEEMLKHSAQYISRASLNYLHAHYVWMAVWEVKAIECLVSKFSSMDAINLARFIIFWVMCVARFPFCLTDCGAFGTYGLWRLWKENSKSNLQTRWQDSIN